MPTYQVEPWADYAMDAPPLWLECSEDHAHSVPLNPNVAAYSALEQNGMLQILTARDNGKLIGYIIFIINRHMHHADLVCGYEDSFFLCKAHRKGITGARMIREGVRLMASAGVKRIFFSTDARRDAGPILERLGFEKSNVVYSLWLGA